MIRLLAFLFLSISVKLIFAQGTNCTSDNWNATSLTNAPSERHGHTAVWSGTEMIIWGGIDNNGYTNTGSKYNPTTDTWTTTSITNAPTARQYHTAVWTGSEMIIWGGNHGNTNSFYNTGGRYNPNTDSWTATSPTNVPTARDKHTAVWTGTEMIVWGGNSTSGYLGTGGKYNPTTGNWTTVSLSNAPISRIQHSGIWTGTEMIIWGGYNLSYSQINSGGKYNPTTNTWTITTTTIAPSARSYHTAVWTGSEMIIWGGGGSGSLTTLNSGSKYNPTTDSWIQISVIGAPLGRYQHTAIWSGTEMIVWGGVISNGFTNTGGRYNPATDYWITTSLINTTTGRREHTSVWTGTEMIVWGGYSGNGYSSIFYNTGAKYKPTTDYWISTTLTNAPTARQLHKSIWTGTEMIIWGGGDINGLTNTGYKYNPITDTWTSISINNAPTTRVDNTVIWTGTEMIVWGGYDGTNNLNTGSRYNPTTNIWTSINTLNSPIGRELHTAIWTGTEMIIWGGCTNHTYLNFTNTGGRYNPTTDSWITTNTTNAPTARESHTSVWTGSEMIIWGGYGFGSSFIYLNTGSRYNPTTNSWIATNLTNAPSARITSSIWTGSEMIIWGGFDGANTLSTGSKYNPTTNNWTTTSLTNVPIARSSYSVIWTGTEMIIWGGYYSSSLIRMNTGGRYNPITDLWTATNNANAPSARSSHTAVWTGSEMIVWGGNFNGSLLNTGGKYYLLSINTIPSLATAIPSSLCSGQSTTLGLTGGNLVTGANWNWYSFSCGGNYVTSGISPVIMPSITTTYWVRAEGTCSTTNCISINILVKNIPLQPSNVFGNICPTVGSTSNYYVINDTNVTNYTWTVSSSWTGRANAY